MDSANALGQGVKDWRWRSLRQLNPAINKFRETRTDQEMDVGVLSGSKRLNRKHKKTGTKTYIILNPVSVHLG